MGTTGSFGPAQSCSAAADSTLNARAPGPSIVPSRARNLTLTVPAGNPSGTTVIAAFILLKRMGALVEPNSTSPASETPGPVSRTAARGALPCGKTSTVIGTLGCESPESPVRAARKSAGPSLDASWSPVAPGDVPHPDRRTSNDGTIGLGNTRLSDVSSGHLQHDLMAGGLVREQDQSPEEGANRCPHSASSASAVPKS